MKETAVDSPDGQRPGKPKDELSLLDEPSGTTKVKPSQMVQWGRLTHAIVWFGSRFKLEERVPDLEMPVLRSRER